MENLEQIIKPLLSHERYIHCIGVADEAVRLAKIYGADAQKAYTAGLLHDCCKELPEARMLELADLYKLDLQAVAIGEKKLYHAPLGAEYIMHELGIADPDIYDAVYYHTMAKPDMPLLTKIIYIADFIEPSRSYEGVEALRQRARSDLDGAILEGLDFTICDLVKRGRAVHPNTFLARNYLIENEVRV